MLVFGHAGITLCTAAVLVSAFRERQRTRTLTGFLKCIPSWFHSLGNYIDIRILLIGSLLPDIIDKPVGQFFFRETFNNGRIFSHTLLFLLLLTVAGVLIYKKYSKTWLITCSFGTFSHLVLDEMWRNPNTLLWPILGLNFERLDISNWTANIFQALFSGPSVYIPEILGLAVVIWLAWELLRERKVRFFLRYGRFE